MHNTHLGIIGGGQLGMLLAQAAIQFPIHISVYDPNPNCPASHFTKSFQQGSFDSTEDLIAFGKKCDILIFETEQTNVEALLELQKMGKKVFSKPEDLQWIQDKGTQKQKLLENDFPVPKESSPKGPFPVVQKFKKGGYDGLGVKIHNDKSSTENMPDMDSLFEEKIDIKTEISVIVARNKSGDIAVYDPVEMTFHEANLVDLIISPARLPNEILKKAKELAQKIAETFNFVGVYATEMFVTQDDEIIINEISPRTHNSGHHTVSANITSQYEQQIRIALGLPLGSVETISPCVLMNLLADESTGTTSYEGLEEAYDILNVQYTFYGKTEVRPNRKMGHALIMEKDLEKSMQKVQKIRNTLTITSHE
jgi:5-(carboxyamino)imidazole ribonucleotide synthase